MFKAAKLTVTIWMINKICVTLGNHNDESKDLKSVRNWADMSSHIKERVSECAICNRMGNKISCYSHVKEEEHHRSF